MWPVWCVAGRRISARSSANHERRYRRRWAEVVQEKVWDIIQSLLLLQLQYFDILPATSLKNLMSPAEIRSGKGHIITLQDGNFFRGHLPNKEEVMLEGAQHGFKTIEAKPWHYKEGDILQLADGLVAIGRSGNINVEISQASLHHEKDEKKIDLPNGIGRITV